MDTIKQVKRTIEFHEINGTIGTKSGSTGGTTFVNLFKHLKKLYTESSSERFFHFDVGRKYMVTGIEFINDEKLVRGKILSIRADVFPQLMEEDDTLVDIDAEKYLGVVETTHFIAAVKRNTLNIGIEFNFEGAKITDFITILREVGKKRDYFRMVDWTPYTGNDLDELEKKVGRVAEFTMKIHTKNIDELDKDLDITGIFGNPQGYFDAQYATYHLKFEYRRKATAQIRNFVMKARRLFKTKPKKMNYIDTFKIRAEDAERGNRLSLFDLLADALKRERYVERKQTSKVIISVSVYEEIHSLLHELELT